MSNHRIPASAGQFSVFTGKRQIRGRTKRVRVLVFTTVDGYVGESTRFNHREAYEAALALKASTTFNALAAYVPKPYERCAKPAPEARMLHQLDESTLFSEVERRGWAVVSHEDAGAGVPQLAAIA